MCFAAKCNPFCGKMQSILRQNAIYFAAKCKLFWAKMQIVLGQNATCFGPKCKSFWAKMQLELRHFNGNDGTFVALVAQPSAGTVLGLLQVVGGEQAVDNGYAAGGIETGNA